MTVLSRSGDSPAGTRTVKGNATDAAAARDAVAGADAVVITVGGAKDKPRHRAAVTRAVVNAMNETGARRLVVQSSLGAGGSAFQLAAPLRLLTPLVLAKPLADHDAQEAIVRDSRLDWTVIRPAGLTGKPGTGAWQASETTEPTTLKGSIPRADVAAAMLSAVQDDTTIGKALGVSRA